MINLGIERRRTHNICERCEEDVSKVGKTTLYKEYDLVLCANCTEEINKEKNLKCPRCRKVVGLDGLTEHRGKQMCYQCVEDVKKKEVKKEERVRFFKTNWFKWIMTGLTVTAIFIAVYWNK